MGAFRSAVIQDIGVIAPSILESIRQDRHQRKFTRFVHLAGQGLGGFGSPGWLKSVVIKEIAKYLAKERGLHF